MKPYFSFLCQPTKLLKMNADLDALCATVTADLKLFAEDEKYRNDVPGILIACERVIACGNNLKRITKKIIYPNHNKKWKEEHNEHLMRMYTGGLTEEQMSGPMQRAPKAIEYQITKLLMDDHVSNKSTITSLAKKYKKDVAVISKSIDLGHKNKTKNK